jgi:hypothetical protein
MTITPDLPVETRFQLRYENRPGYLFVHVTGPDDSFEITLAYWLEIARECSRRGVRRVLVLDDLYAEQATEDELDRLIAALVGAGFEGMRVAFVEPRSERLARVEHAELKARELGYTVRVFSEQTTADLWLRHGEH